MALSLILYCNRVIEVMVIVVVARSFEFVADEQGSLLIYVNVLEEKLS